MVWLFYAILSAISDSCSRLCDKKASEYIEPALATALYYGVEMGIFLFFLYTWRSHISSFSWSSTHTPKLLFIIASSIIGSISWLLYMQALRHGSFAQVSLAQQVGLVVSVGLSGLLFGDSINAMQAIGAVFIAVGTALLARA